MKSFARTYLNRARNFERSVSNGLFAFVIIAVVTLSPCASFSEASDATFNDAVTAFKAGKLEEARKHFLELEAKDPSNEILLFNLGLIAQKEKRLGAALGLWRKALVENPASDTLGNAIDWTRSKLAKGEIAHETEVWEDFRRTVLTKLSPAAVTLSACLFLLLAGWRLLRWLGARRRAHELETAMPALPVGGFVLLTAFIAFLGISIAMMIDRLDVRGTILPAKVDVLSAPDITATQLFDLFEGMEVIVRDTRTIGEQQWRRITYPGGMTGWIRDRDVFTPIDSSARLWEQ